MMTAEVVQFTTDQARHQQEWLAEQLEFEACWREQKACEFPDDDRKQHCADALRRFAAYVLALSAGHPVFRKLAAIDDINSFVDDFNFFKSKYFFHYSGKKNEEYLKMFNEVLDERLEADVRYSRDES